MLVKKFFSELFFNPASIVIELKSALSTNIVFTKPLQI